MCPVPAIAAPPGADNRQPESGGYPRRLPPASLQAGHGGREIPPTGGPGPLFYPDVSIAQFKLVNIHDLLFHDPFFNRKPSEKLTIPLFAINLE